MLLEEAEGTQKTSTPHRNITEYKRQLPDVRQVRIPSFHEQPHPCWYLKLIAGKMKAFSLNIFLDKSFPM
jgi:hypothetical protein